MRVLLTFLDVVGKGSLDVSVLAYLAALLPSQKNNPAFRGMITGATGATENEDDEDWSWLYTPEMLPDLTTTVLFLSLLVAMLDNAVYENQQLFIFHLLEQAVRARTSIAALLFG